MSKPKNYWNYDTCCAEAKKYSSRNEFKHGNETAYRISRENKWIDDYDWLKPQLNLLTFEECDSRISFCHGNSPAYQSARKYKWLDDYTWLKYKKQKPKGYWTYETCYEETKKYKTRTSFSKNCNRAYLVSLTNDWLKDYIWFNDNTIKPRVA